VSAFISTQSNNWFALQVRSRHEKCVVAQLEAKQHEVFLPVYATRHKWADRWKTVELPLFAGYVFCRFSGVSRSSVMATTGVIDVVRTGRDPAQIEDSVISAIHRVVNSPLMTEPCVGLTLGEPVVLTDGPLAGLHGKLVEIRGSARFVISVELLQRSVLVEIDRVWVSPLRSVAAQYGAAMTSISVKA
jgi:transcription antitermination factor NusG